MKTHANILKFNYRYSWILVLAISIVGSCSKDDGPETETIITPPIVVEKTIFGKWEITSGRLLSDNAKYVHINEENTINVLSEDVRGFKRDFTTNITVTDIQLTISTYSSDIHNYTLDEDKLTITLPRGQGEVKLVRNNGVPGPDNWVKELTIIDEGDAPWSEDVDIAFNGTHILYGNGYEAENIGLVNPNDFSLAGEIITSQSAFAVEVEKYSGPDKYIFQSDNGSSRFRAFFEDTNSEGFQSLEMGSWIKGLASVDETRVWVSSGNESALYLYQYSGSDEIISTINLDFQPFGMDYQDGYLYISDGVNIHKCDLTSSLRAVETYRVQNHKAKGIAYDGSNFWLSTNTAEGGKLIKVDLSI